MSQEIFRKLRQMLMEKLDVYRELTDQEILETIDELIVNTLRESGVSLKEKVQLRQELFYSVRKLDVLQELIEDETVTEIMVNGPDSIFVERKGKLTRWPKSFTDQEKLEDVIQQIVGKCNRIVNESSPIVDARLENGARVNVVVAPVALNGPILTIRRFPDTPITMEKLIELGSITPECASFLEKLVRARYSIVIGGGTGSGKTTFLGALSEYIPKDERIITIEDNAELKLQGIANLVRLEARTATINGAPGVSIRDLIKSALRMRPDRIIVGEVRGGEAMDMLQALNTGHEGSLGTAHANSCRDMLARLEIMTLMAELDLPLQAVRRQIASGVDILVHLGRMRDKSRKLLEAMWNMDGDTVAQGIDRAHQEISILKYNDENTLSCTINLAFYFAREYYTIIRELPAGKGFADICLIPRKIYADKPAAVIELKWNKSVEGAISQIKEKRYVDALKDYQGNLLLVAVNYDKNTKRHSCEIEKLEISKSKE